MKSLHPLRIRPVSLVHRGVVESTRCWVPDAEETGLSSRPRLLGMWQPGTILRRGPGGVLVEWASPLRIDTRAAMGLALLPQDGRSTSAPLHASDVAAAPPHALLLLQQGAVQHIDWTELEVVDPSTWLELGDFEVVSVTPLGDPPAPAVVTMRTQNLRQVFGVSVAPGRLAMLPAPAPASSLQGTAGRAVGQAAAQVGRWLQKAPLPQWMADQGNWLERWGAKLGLTGALSALFGLQHAQYLRDLMLRFDDGDWLGGIQHAIPLRTDGKGPSLPSMGPSLDWLRPREGLEYGGTAATEGGRSVGLATDLFERLKQLYRRAFEGLDQQKRYREAAYVLAELLGEIEEALTYLEGLGEFRLAADLAEARGLDPARLVFLWIRAGDRQRAMGIARLYAAWGAAVEHFERRNLTQPAEWLRLEWAEHLALAGRYAAAVEVAWPVPGGRQRAEDWLEQAVSAGGLGGAKSLARSLELLPEPFERWKEPIEALLEDDTADGPTARAALGRALPSTAAGRRVARGLGRQLIRDAARLDGGAAVVRHCAQLAADGALLTDLPTLPSGPPPRQEGRVDWAISAADTGTVSVLDAVALPKDRVLVALGELGARLVSPAGETLATFAHPTHRLVASPDGRRVLLLGRRGRAFTIARLDPVTRVLSSWCEAELDAFCDTFDGSVWFVAQKGQILALDTHMPGLSAGWTLDLVERHGRYVVPLLAWSPASLQIAVASGEKPAWYTASLPALTLKLQAPIEKGQAVAVSERGLLHTSPALHWMSPDKSELLLGDPEPIAREAGGDFVAFAMAEELAAASWSQTLPQRGLQLAVWAKGGSWRASLRLEGASQVALRFQRDPPLLVVADDRGRVRVIDLISWTLRA